MWAVILWILQAPASPVEVAEGREVLRLRCAECHGAEGEGGRGPNLSDGVFYHGATDADLYRTIENGITGTEMPAFAFSEKRIGQLVAVIRSLNRAAEPTRLPGSTEGGQKIFREMGGCLSCHRVGREGGFTGPDLTLVGSRRSLQHLRTSIVDPNGDVSPRYWVATATAKDSRRFRGFLLAEDRHSLQLLDFEGKLRSLKKDELASVDVDRSSIMQSFAGVFDEREMNDLVSYLATLRTEVRR